MPVFVRTFLRSLISFLIWSLLPLAIGGEMDFGAGYAAMCAVLAVLPWTMRGVDEMGEWYRGEPHH